MTEQQEKKLRDTVRCVCLELDSIQRRLHEVGLSCTAKRINEASQDIGWEAAEKLTRKKRKGA